MRFVPLIHSARPLQCLLFRFPSNRFPSIQLFTAALLCAVSHCAGSLCAEPPSADWFPRAAPLPAPAGQVLRVSSVQQLFEAAEDVHPGGTILVADGHYMMPRYFELHTDDVTLRSASGNRHKVVLDGAQSKHGELVGVSNCRNVTIADLTIQNIKWNGFKINSNKYATGVTIRNCVIHNIWQRGVKGPAVGKKDRGKFWPTDCRIEYCLFYNDRPKQFSDDPADTPESFGGNYVGGIDAMHARRWVIANNVFVGIHGRTGEGRGAIFLWNESRDCVVERNIIIDCDCGICLGNHHRNADTRWHDNGCVVRNNFVTGCAETGILAAHTRDCKIVHNTIHEPESRLRRLLWVQDDNEGLQVANNLLSGPDVLDTGNSKIDSRNNVAVKNLSSAFADAAAGNLRLTRAMSSVAPLPKQVPHDIDGAQRPQRPMVGAHEFTDTATAPKEALEQRPPNTAKHTQPGWVEPMRKVHQDFQGTSGYVAQFGDSITHSMAFWSPMGWSYPDKYLTQDDGLPKTPPGERWRDVIQGTRDKGPEFANYSGWRVGQLLKAVDKVLEKQKPEIAMIMIGTNDISGNRVPDTYADQLAQVVDKCLAAHCVPLLSTIPPRRGHDASVSQVNAIIRKLAASENIPLVDFHAECLLQQPGNAWDGTVISPDGVHPSGGKSNVYTADNLKQCGYALRNWANFQMVRQIYFRVLHPATATPGESAPPAAAKPANATNALTGGPAAIPNSPHLNTAPPDEPTWAAVCAPRIVTTRVADAYSMRTFSNHESWRKLTGDQRAYAVYQYLADCETGLFHMNVVAEGNDGLSEFEQIRDPVKIINVYGYAYCGILGPTMAGVCEGIGLGPSRTLVLPAWNHVAAESFYGGQWHYLDLDVRAVFRRSDGTLASMAEAQQDASLWQGRGPLFFPNDPLDATRATYQKTEVQTYYGFQQSGHTMDFVLRPGERLTRWWKPQGGRWHHLAQYNKQPWLRSLIETSPRGPKPNHRHFTVHNYGNGQFVYQPKLTSEFTDFAHGVSSAANVAVTSSGLTLLKDGTGCAIFEVRSPYVIVPQVRQLENTADDRDASTVEFAGRRVDVSISLDNGITWSPVSKSEAQADQSDVPNDTIDLTPWVSGTYGYLLKFTLEGRVGEALLSKLKMTSWVQLAPASLPSLAEGSNRMRLVTGDHHGQPTRVKEIRSRASHPEQLLKYLATPPDDYDPTRKTDRIHGTVTVVATPSPGTKIAWFTATGQFRTHQQANATKTRNSISYALNRSKTFHTLYESDVPTYAGHWHYNAAREHVLDTPAETLALRYTGDPALNNFAVYLHCLPDRPYTQLPLEVTHTWSENGERKSAHVTLDQNRQYEVVTDAHPDNESIEMAVLSLAR